MITGYVWPTPLLTANLKVPDFLSEDGAMSILRQFTDDEISTPLSLMMMGFGTSRKA